MATVFDPRRHSGTKFKTENFPSNLEPVYDTIVETAYFFGDQEFTKQTRIDFPFYSYGWEDIEYLLYAGYIEERTVERDVRRILYVTE